MGNRAQQRQQRQITGLESGCRPTKKKDGMCNAVIDTENLEMCPETVDLTSRSFGTTNFLS